MVLRKALVTGGAHPIGIGYASAQALADADYEVLVTAISPEEAALCVGDDRIRAVVLDVRNQNAIDAVLSGFDRLDALVNCAGASSLDESDPETFSRILDINLTGTLRVCNAARPLLAKQGGAIVNFASMYAIFGSGVVPGYSASKGGVMQLTKSLAIAWANEGIRVNAVAPGHIKTEMARPMWENAEWAKAVTDRTPLGRWGDAAEVGDVVEFLCSHKARFVTGMMLPVDGGFSIYG